MTPETIYYLIDEQGGLTIGDAISGVTVYAYPTSPHADAVRKAAPERRGAIARRIVSKAAEGWRGRDDLVAAYDRGNWERLGPAVEALPSRQSRPLRATRS